MKKQRKKRRGGMSAGTIAMLLLTVAVLAGCAIFMGVIAGEEIKSRADEALEMIKSAGVTLMSEEESARIRSNEMLESRRQTAAPISAEATKAPQQRTHEAVTFTLAAAGTVTAPKAVSDGALSAKGEYDFGAVFSGLGDALSEADLAIATLETATAGQKKGYGGYNAPAALLSALRDCGVDVLSLGTERALDMGYDGLEMTVGEITARGIAHTGVSLEGGVGAVGSIGGVQVAVLGYSYGLSEEGKANASPEEHDALALLDMQRMSQDIRRVRAEGANVVIVLPHWGTKNKQETPDEVKKMALALAQAGADVILGAHPNVVQGTERLVVTRADGLEYETVVCYSLGSLLSDARAEENTAGMIAQLTITYDPQTRRTTLGSLACVPIYIARQKENGTNVFRVTEVENAQAMSLLTPSEQENAQRAAQRVREVTGQSKMEDEGQG